MWNTYELLLEYGIHTLDRNGLGSLVVRHPSTGGETRFDSWSGQNLSYISLSPPYFFQVIWARRRTLHLLAS